MPQPPQLLSFLETSTQLAPQRRIPVGQTHLPEVHDTASDGHALPQLPQFARLVEVL